MGFPEYRATATEPCPEAVTVTLPGLPGPVPPIVAVAVRSNSCSSLRRPRDHDRGLGDVERLHTTGAARVRNSDVIRCNAGNVARRHDYGQLRCSNKRCRQAAPIPLDGRASVKSTPVDGHGERGAAGLYGVGTQRSNGTRRRRRTGRDSTYGVVTKVGEPHRAIGARRNPGWVVDRGIGEVGDHPGGSNPPYGTLAELDPLIGKP